MLALRGCIATCATDTAAPAIPFWPRLFKNISVDFLGSENFTPEVKAQAAQAVNEALEAGWRGFENSERFPIEAIAAAHEPVESPSRRGRIVLIV